MEGKTQLAQKLFLDIIIITLMKQNPTRTNLCFDETKVTKESKTTEENNLTWIQQCTFGDPC